MRPKKIDKKLDLNKVTVVNLDVKKMKVIKGGFTGLELCSQRPILCDTAQCPAETADCETYEYTCEAATCVGFTCDEITCP